MSSKWQVRFDGEPAFAQDAANPPANASTIEVGDNVFLYLAGDKERREDVCIRVTGLVGIGAMVGEISRSNRMGLGGDSTLLEGAAVEFDRQNIFRFEKASRL